MLRMLLCCLLVEIIVCPTIMCSDVVGKARCDKDIAPITLCIPNRLQKRIKIAITQLEHSKANALQTTLILILQQRKVVAALQQQNVGDIFLLQRPEHPLHN
jgi:hypothetical protein